MFENIGSGFVAVALALVRALPGLLRDAAGFAAVASIAYGSSLLHPAAGYIVGGALVLVGVMLASRPVNRTA